MASKHFIVVIDETGTTNRPNEARESDFGVAALVLPPTAVEQMRSVGVEIAGVTTADFKYKHVQKSAEGRRLFLGAMQHLRREEGLYGFYAAGGSLLNERHRAYAAVQRHGTDIGGSTKAALDRMLADPNGEMLISFFQYMAPSLGMFAGKHNATMDVYFDRRNDLGDILTVCDDAKALSAMFDRNPQISSRLAFKGQALKEHQPLVRLAGVIAGDIRCFFRRYGGSVWSRLRTTHDIRPDEMRGDPRDADEVTRLMHVATVQEQIGDGNFFEPSAETCMLRGYTKRFLSGLLSFASPEGKLGNLKIQNNASWEILQLPD